MNKSSLYLVRQSKIFSDWVHRFVNLHFQMVKQEQEQLDSKSEQY